MCSLAKFTMVDQAEILVKAGNGGNGCNSFKGAKHTRLRHPDGGSGGRGADVILRVDRNIQDLERFKFNPRFQGENGKIGQSNKKKGADARPCIIKVPRGTLVYELEHQLFLGDLVEQEAELAVAVGGEGGRGNSRAKPATPGGAGEQKRLLLEFRLVADVGIIGSPNSGKSSLLARITSSRPKIAHYPFTTITPLLGVLQFADLREPAGLTLVELPGLVNGSTAGKGLGAQFLRHAQRCRVFIHLVDMAAQEGRSPLEDYGQVNRELERYNLALARKQQLLAANKMDLPEATRNLKQFSAKVKEKVYPISALSGEGIENLLKDLRGFFKDEQKFTAQA